MKLLVALLMGLALSTASYAEQGTRGGGDQVAYEFAVAANRLLKLFQENESLRQLVPQLRVEALEEATRTVQLESRDRLFLEKREVDAINYPVEKRIEVSAARWNGNKKSGISRLSLVAHEYMGILGIDDENYKVSYQISGWFYANGLGDFTCAVRKLGERGRDDDGVELKRLEFINAITYELYVDGKMALTIAHQRDEEAVTTYFYDTETSEVLSRSSVKYRPGELATATHYTKDNRYVHLACNEL